MRTLVLSDIHDNIEHIKLLREKERNVYDAVIVAGDIGNKIAEEFLSVLDSFDCPCFCVFGNWDYDLNYEASLSNRCTLLHHNIERIEGFFITGFSGCPTKWGKNPIYLDNQKKLEEKHKSILSQLDDERRRVADQKLEVEDKHQEELDSVRSRSSDRRLKEYKKKVARIEARKEREFEKAEKAIERMFRTSEYKQYEGERRKLAKSTLLRNRIQLFDKIRSSSIPDEKLIIVTHERMHKIAEEGVSPLLHIYGHIHEYKFGLFKGTYYLNAAAIDNGFSELFGRKEILPEGYCIVTLFAGKVSVERKRLFQDASQADLG